MSELREANSFLSGIMYRYALNILRRTVQLYELTEQQEDILREVFLNPSDWSVEIEEAIRGEPMMQGC